MNLSAITAWSVVLCAVTVDRTMAFSLTKMPRTLTSQSPAVLHATLADDSTTTATTKITTGPDGKAALNYDEDLRLTLQIIMDHQRRSATVSTEQLVQQVTAAAAIVPDSESATVDIRVPYDAAAQLAYDQEPSSVQSSMTFGDYKIQYEAKAVAHVIAKKASSKSATTTPKVAAAVGVVTKEETVGASSAYDVSIPYDAAAKLAYQALSAEERSKTDYHTFQQLYTQNAVADVIAKKARNDPTTTTTVQSAVAASTAPSTTTTSDVSVPYDSAAKLAYSKLDSIKHSLTYEQFRQQYEKNAVLNVVAKKLKRYQQQQQASTK